MLDVRRDVSDDDRQMFEILAELETPVLVCVTKTDKLSKSAVAGRVREIAVALVLEEDQVIAFSAVSGAGRDELAEAVVALVAQAKALPGPTEG